MDVKDMSDEELIGAYSIGIGQWRIECLTEIVRRQTGGKKKIS